MNRPREIKEAADDSPSLGRSRCCHLLKPPLSEGNGNQRKPTEGYRSHAAELRPHHTRHAMYAKSNFAPQIPAQSKRVQPCPTCIFHFFAIGASSFVILRTLPDGYERSRTRTSGHERHSPCPSRLCGLSPAVFRAHKRVRTRTNAYERLRTATDARTATDRL
jgi:hypothetical protein